MKRLTTPLLAWTLVMSCGLGIPPQEALAIPNVFIGGGFIGPIVPSQPVFNANLTTAFLSIDHWKTGDFPGPWRPATTVGDEELRSMARVPILFGAVPDSVMARREARCDVREIVITYLDAATFFPYLSGGEKTREQRENGEARRAEFDARWQELDRALRQRLEAGCGQTGELSVAGRRDPLRVAYTDYAWEDFRLRLARRPHHSIALHLSRLSEPAPGWIEEDIADLDKRERADLLAERVQHNERDEPVITGVPIFDQGFTPYCGVHALAMVAHYHGLRLLPGELAAGAEFKNTGSARGSRILDLYRAVGEELDLDFSHSARFDARRAGRALRDGFPVIVWRRVALEREKAHAELAARFAAEPNLAAAVPPLDPDTLSELPDRKKTGSPSHASVIIGIDEQAGTVIYLELWGTGSGVCRMRIEELEATAYASFFYAL
ncbi:MAG: hypothetical protein KDN19_19600 [Verrucomicrobiae bacterium]|nr:hypothetical protein [Verrucomicrobiae bacterium]